MQSLLVLVIGLDFLSIQRQRDYQGCFFKMHISGFAPLRLGFIMAGMGLRSHIFTSSLVASDSVRGFGNLGLHGP